MPTALAPRKEWSGPTLAAWSALSEVEPKLFFASLSPEVDWEAVNLYGVGFGRMASRALTEQGIKRLAMEAEMSPRARSMFLEAASNLASRPTMREALEEGFAWREARVLEGESRRAQATKAPRL